MRSQHFTFNSILCCPKNTPLSSDSFVAILNKYAAFHRQDRSSLGMGVAKKEKSRKERQGKVGDGMNNVKVKGENFYRYSLELHNRFARETV